MVDKNRINWARRGGACAFTEQLFKKGVIGAKAVLSLLLETQTTALSLSSLLLQLTFQQEIVILSRVISSVVRLGGTAGQVKTWWQVSFDLIFILFFVAGA